jgi:hypothetical protein
VVIVIPIAPVYVKHDIEFPLIMDSPMALLTKFIPVVADMSSRVLLIILTFDPATVISIFVFDLNVFPSIIQPYPLPTETA